MTGFFSRCLKNAWLECAAWLACACLLAILPLQAQAAGETANAEVNQLLVERKPDGVVLSATLKFDLPSAVEDALHKGVPMFFVAEADVYRARWYWYDKKVLSAERHIRLAFQPLTRRWRINVASGTITASSLGLALNQSFESLADALGAIKRISNWKIAEPGELEAEPRHSVEFRFRLDLSQLPRPFQIGVLGQADWNIFATSTQALTQQVAR